MSLLKKVDTVKKFIELRDKKIEDLQKTIEETQGKIDNEIAQNGPNSRRIEIYRNQIRRAQHQILTLELEKSFARPDFSSDLEERNNAYRTFSTDVEKVLSNNLHLKFHGTDICGAAQIIKSGQISSSVDRIGVSTSYDVDGQVSVSEKDTLHITTNGYTDLCRKFLPAGCIFAVLPKNEVEDRAGKSLLMDNVYFRSNPDQLYAIITTTENKDMVTKWCLENGITAPVVTFEEALEKMENDSKSIDKAVELLADKIDLSNFVDIVSAIAFGEKHLNSEKSSIDDVIDKFENDKPTTICNTKSEIAK